MKKIIYLLIVPLLIGLGSCSDDKETSTDIIGKWKLEKAKSTFEKPQEYDYSLNNIFYEFRADGTVIVSSDIDQYHGDSPGTYLYKLTQPDGEDKKLSIDNTVWWYRISDKELILDLSPLDGAVLYLVR